MRTPIALIRPLLATGPLALATTLLAAPNGLSVAPRVAVALSGRSLTLATRPSADFITQKYWPYAGWP